MEKQKTVTISLKEYISLKNAEAFLAALEENGVDNWSGYSESIDICESGVFLGDSLTRLEAAELERRMRSR
jgi:hypothetical protein